MSENEQNSPSKDENARNEAIFNSELIPHIDALFNFAIHLTYDEERANDLVQETYMKAWRFIGSFESGTNGKAWLFKILKNAFINEYRKQAKRPTKVDFEDVVKYHDAEEGTGVGYLDLNQDIFQGMLGDEVSRALDSLPVDFRTVVLLCDIEGFTYEEIAKIVDIPIGTVRSRLHRARGMLKGMLEAYASKMGYKN